jgi:hypothetical protein
MGRGHVSRPHIVFGEFGEVLEYGLTPIEAAREEGAQARSEGWEPSLYHGLARFLNRADAERLSSPPVSPGGLGGKEKLSFAPLSSALANVPSEPAWTWDGYLGPGSITLWAGRPKVGKSTTSFGLFSAIVEGRPFLDRPTRATGVLLLSEEREGTLAEKARRWNLDGRVHLLMRHQANGREWPEIIAEAADYCKTHGLGVLAVDTWDKWTGLKGDSENNAGAVVAALEPLIHAAGSGLSVLIVAH